MEHLAEICRANCKHSYDDVWDLTGSLADLLADLHEKYKIVKLEEHTRGRTKIDIILDVGKTRLCIFCEGKHKVFNDRFNYLKKLYITFNSVLDYSGGSIKYFYDRTNDDIYPDHVEYMVIDSYNESYMKYYSDKIYHTKEVTRNIRSEFKYSDIRVRQYYYQGGKFLYADRYRCDVIHLQEVLDFDVPKCIIVEGNVTIDNLAPLYTCEVPRIKIRTPINTECITKLLENTHIRYLSVQTMDAPIKDISQYPHLVQFKVRYNKDESGHFRSKRYRKQLLSMSHCGSHTKSARSV